MSVAVVLGLALAAGILAALVAGSAALFRLARAVESVSERLAEQLPDAARPVEALLESAPRAGSGTARESVRIDSPPAVPADTLPDPLAGEVTAVAWEPPAPVAMLGSLGYGLRYAVAARRGRISAADPVPVAVRAHLAARRAADRAATKAARREVRRAGLAGTAASGGM